MKLSNKKISKKVKGLIRSDVMNSVALVSVLVNVFFFSGVVLFNATNQLDVSMYEAAVNNLCTDNYTENLAREVDESKNPSEAKANFEVVCRSGEFTRYYENAVEAYLNNTL